MGLLQRSAEEHPRCPCVQGKVLLRWMVPPGRLLRWLVQPGAPYQEGAPRARSVSTTERSGTFVPSGPGASSKRSRVPGTRISDNQWLAIADER